jgi:NAD(P)-dependent dehydrogenase (short-subunit alcohol dehydrogenase family)
MSGNGTSDPRTRHPSPPQEEQRQQPPGVEAGLRPQADHGEGSYIGNHRLLERVALITGGDSGIGRAVALAFAREGANVAISYLEEHEDARETARLVESAGQRALLLPGDLGSREACGRLVGETVAAFGRIDLLVNNAAHQREVSGLAELSTEEWRRTFAINVDAMFWLCQAALPHLRPGSSIINTASVQAFDPSPELLAYATTKGAIVTFSQALAQEAIKQGVRVNVVAPGPVWTPLIPATLSPEKVAGFGKSTPIGRAAQPAELAGVYVFLASECASYVTGAVYVVAGGRVVR